MNKMKNKEEKMAIRIQECRKRLGLTQEELGEKVGVQKSAIAKYEKGRVTNIKRDVIKAMSTLFEVSPSWLMGFDDESNGNNNDFLNLDSKGRNQYQKFMSDASLYFNDEKISLEDKEKIFNSLQEIFFEVKLANKKKK